MASLPPAATQSVVVAPAAAPPNPRWISLVTVIITILGSVTMVGGVLLTIGAWRAQINMSITDLQKRMDKAEENQRTYIPVLIGLSKDVSFLADRARREDEARDREERR